MLSFLWCLCPCCSKCANVPGVPLPGRRLRRRHCLRPQLSGSAISYSASGGQVPPHLPLLVPFTARPSSEPPCTRTEMLRRCHRWMEADFRHGKVVCSASPCVTTVSKLHEYFHPVSLTCASDQSQLHNKLYWTKLPASSTETIHIMFGYARKFQVCFSDATTFAQEVFLRHINGAWKHC